MESHWSTWPLRVVWNVLRIALGIGAVCGLLIAAVFLVLGIIAFGEGRAVECMYALRYGIMILMVAAVLERGSRFAKRRAFRLAISQASLAKGFDEPVAAMHFNRGLTSIRKGRYDQAIAHYDAAIRLDPGFTEAHIDRIHAYGRIGDIDRAVADYTAAIERDPDNALAYAARATAWNLAGQFYRSIPDASEAIRLDPHLYLGYDARGYGLLQRGGYRFPLPIIALAWWLLTFGFLRGQVDLATLMTTGSKADYEQAIADFTEAIRLKPTAWDCYVGRARIYRALGEHARAAEDLARVRRSAFPG